MTYNFLIVDDSKTIRSIISKTLELTELNVGQIFELECLQDNWIDLIFADCNMPVMGGVGTIDRMEETEVTKLTLA